MTKREIEKMINVKCQMTNGKWLSLTVCCWFLIVLLAPAARAQSTQTQAATPDFQSIIARQSALVSEFDVNGLKVLVKRREGSQTVAAGLFIRGGVENINADNAGVESLMLNVGRIYIFNSADRKSTRLNSSH